MINKTAVLGFPRIGEKRELKTALEGYWKGSISFNELQILAYELRLRHWLNQNNAGIDTVAIKDFSFYDNMLDLMVILGAEPERFSDIVNPTRRYFTMARGDETHVAMEMTKWFNTNYHYLVPELHKEFTFGAINPDKIIQEHNEASLHGLKGRIQRIGPITFLALSKCSEEVRIKLFDPLLNQYVLLLNTLQSLGAEIVMH